MADNILSIKDLTVHYAKGKSIIRAVNGMSLSLGRGETLGLVGETGAGKTTAAKSIMRLIADPPGRIVSGSIIFEGMELLSKSKTDMRKIRGEKISMIFQDPMTSLNPVLTIGDQVSEVIRIHKKLSFKEAGRKAVKMLETVGIAADRFGDYPHQFSGGMKQRVIIAIALICNPAVLIADEPTTALDVTIQAQVLDLMKELKSEYDTSMILITHDLGIVADICDRVAIMYAGDIVECGNLSDIYVNACHPYTKGLFGSIPDLDGDAERLKPIQGLMPDPANLPSGCSFHPRCPDSSEACRGIEPEKVDLTGTHSVKCLLYKN